MGSIDFGFIEAPTDYTIPAGCTEVEVWVTGGGTEYDYQPVSSGAPNGDPYVITIPARGYYLVVPVAPGDVLTITPGGRSHGSVGGWPDGGHASSSAYPYGENAPGKGGGGATRILLNGAPWMVAAGAGGSAAGLVVDTTEFVLVPGPGPSVVPPEDPPLPGFGGIPITLITGDGAPDEHGADGVANLGMTPNVITVDYPTPHVCYVGNGAGGGGFYGGASGGFRHYYPDELAESEGDPHYLVAGGGRRGYSVMPVDPLVLWEPGAAIAYGEPGDPGYDPELGGIPDPGYVVGGENVAVGTDGGRVRLASPFIEQDDTAPWSVGRVRV